MLEIRLFASLRKGRSAIIKIPFEPGITGEKLLTLFSILKEDVSIFLVNGFHSSLNVEISDGDIISIFPPVGGG
ncbi:MoaD/ThiS family protein [Cetobacterium somerae]|uniref:MoaD/ThiS family protein n=1 Tax=Cetobacterium sp. NK01 TaxID=2993530 RepID=UPI002116AB39|nr:MoaD/ThiS family protein [Cetobacterium sp. NK01]MCQ8212940.1 MoaD/ThiS family protein [Cetobacterium sp. NK01]